MKREDRDDMLPVSDGVTLAIFVALAIVVTVFFLIGLFVSAQKVIAWLA